MAGETGVRRYLVVANRTLGGAPLIETVRACVAAGPSRFYLVVPATLPSGSFTDEEVHEGSRGRLDRALERLRAAGVEVDGEVGDHRPMDAIGDALNREAFDEIIISTLPHLLSHWLKVDLPQRAREKFGLPVTHVIGAEEPP